MLLKAQLLMQNEHLHDPNVLTHFNVSGIPKQMNFICSWQTKKNSFGWRFPHKLIPLDSPLPFIWYHTHSSAVWKPEEEAAASAILDSDRRSSSEDAQVGLRLEFGPQELVKSHFLYLRTNYAPRSVAKRTAGKHN